LQLRTFEGPSYATATLAVLFEDMKAYVQSVKRVSGLTIGTLSPCHLFLDDTTAPDCTRYTARKVVLEHSVKASSSDVSRIAAAEEQQRKRRNIAEAAGITRDGSRAVMVIWAGGIHRRVTVFPWRAGPFKKYGVVSLQGKDLTPDEMDRVSSLFQQLQTCGVLTKGACSTELGERRGNLHIQGCFCCPSLNRDNAEVQEAVKCLVHETAEFTGVNRHVYAVVHEPAHEPNVTWRAQLGCVCKSSAFCVSFVLFLVYP
jgi:hypothetical protein